MNSPSRLSSFGFCCIWQDQLPSYICRFSSEDLQPGCWWVLDQLRNKLLLITSQPSRILTGEIVRGRATHPLQRTCSSTTCAETSTRPNSDYEHELLQTWDLNRRSWFADGVIRFLKFLNDFFSYKMRSWKECRREGNLKFQEGLYEEVGLIEMHWVLLSVLQILEQTVQQQDCKTVDFFGRPCTFIAKLTMWWRNGRPASNPF